MSAIQEHGTYRTFGEARYLSRVERALSDAFESLGLHVDRSIGVRVDDVRVQPSFSVMPTVPDDFDAVWHADFLGVIEVASDVDVEVLVRTFRRAPACEFVLAVKRDRAGVAIATAAERWAAVHLVPDETLVFMGVAVPVSLFTP